MLKIINFDDYEIQFSESDALKEKVYQTVLKWFKTHELFSGEVIVQSDAGAIESPQLLAKLANEVFQFEWNEKEQISR